MDFSKFTYVTKDWAFIEVRYVRSVWLFEWDVWDIEKSLTCSLSVLIGMDTSAWHIGVHEVVF